MSRPVRAEDVGRPVRVRRDGTAGTLREWSHTAGGHTRARISWEDADGVTILQWFHAHELEPVEEVTAAPRMEVLE